MTYRCLFALVSAVLLASGCSREESAGVGEACVFDECGQCNSDPADACVQDCAGTWGGPALEDNCGVCDTDPDNDCEQDCAGTWGGSAYVDACGSCDDDVRTDCVQDCEGTWGGSAYVDQCGYCDDDPTSDCEQDCAGVWGGTASLDECGVCDTDVSNDCIQDCAGNWGGTAYIDACNVCDADPATDCVQDCAGVWGGSSYVDACGTCDHHVTNDCTQDCAGVWGGPSLLDNCGVCDEDASNDCMQDCAGTWGGFALEDNCGGCDTDPSNDCTQDCAGTWGGVAVLDNCGSCDDDASNDCLQDCAGVWGGLAYLDTCGSCDDDVSNDCTLDCAGTWGGDAYVDACGVCDADPSNDDSCGPCDTEPCGPGSTCTVDGDGFICACRAGFAGTTCNEDIDECLNDNGGCTGSRSTCVNTMGSYFCVDAETTQVYPETTHAHAERHYRVGIILVNGKEPFPADRADYVYSSAMSYRLSFYDPEDVGEQVFESPYGVKAFFDEVSYGKENISGVVVDWQSDFDEALTASDLQANRDLYFAEAWSAIDPSQFDAFLLVGLADAGTVDTTSTGTVFDETGEALFDKGIIYLVNVPFYTEAGKTRWDGGLVPSVPWQHGILLSMGLAGGSQSLWCYSDLGDYETAVSDQQYYERSTVALSSACDVKDHGDPFSLMGEGLWATHPSAASKAEMGWIREQGGLLTMDVSILGSSQVETTDVLLYPHAAQDLSKVLAVQVDVPSFSVNTVDGNQVTFDRVTIEYRAPVGLDEYMSALGQGPRPHSVNASWYLESSYVWEDTFGGTYELEPPIDIAGALVYLDSSTDETEAVYLVDANPARAGVRPDVLSPRGYPGNAGKFASAMVALGQTFRSDVLPFDLSVVEVVTDSAGNSAIRVRIEPSTD